MMGWASQGPCQAVVFDENIRTLGVAGKPVQDYHLKIEQSFSE
jgi:hypothetical protein